MRIILSCKIFFLKISQELGCQNNYVNIDIAQMMHWIKNNFQVIFISRSSNKN